MTDLVMRLRALADEHKHPLVGWEQRLVATIREAADALEIVRDECYRKNCIALFDDNEILKAKLDDAKLGEAKAWQRVHELTDKLTGASALLEHARDCHVETAKRAEKAEAEVAQLKATLEGAK